MIISICKNNQFSIENNLNILNIHDVNKNKLFKKELKSANKIIIHGMWSIKLNIFFFFNRQLLYKAYWVIWGGDLYFYRDRTNSIKDLSKEFFRKFVIKRLAGIIAYNKKEYDLAISWYKSKAKFYPSFFYPSNLYEKVQIIEKEDSNLNIQIGNSADSSNNHIEILKMLEKYKNENIKIFVPLSYGDMQYADKIIDVGIEIFGNKFIPIKEYMNFNDYISLLGTIDIAIFNHDRQQAMGNITTLLGLGKKVYMRSSTTSYTYFNDLNISVYDIKNFKLKKIEDDIKNNNIRNVKEYFSINTLIMQWKKIFERKEEVK